MTETEKLLRELIALPSINPAFLAVGAANAGEARVAEFLKTKAARAGLEAECKRALPGRSNLLIRLVPPCRVRQRILLAPHLDTVNAEPAQLLPRRSNGRLYGRG